MNICKLALILVVFSGLTGCKHSWWKAEDEQHPFQGIPAKQLYTEARAQLAKKEYSSAIKRLEALDTLYPFNDYAEPAELDLIYAYYKKEDYALAAATADRCIHLYPRAKNIDYAYYMKGLAHFQQPRGALANMFPMDDSWRDPGTQSQAYSDFATFIQKFPESKYRANAAQRMIYLRNMFAQHELDVASYYFERKMYVAAVERAGFLIKTYPQAPSTEAALSIIYWGNLALGFVSTAQDALTVYLATYHHNPKENVAVQEV